MHRFEDDELVVAAEDEGRVDDLVSELDIPPADLGRTVRTVAFGGAADAAGRRSGSRRFVDVVCSSAARCRPPACEPTPPTCRPMPTWPKRPP